MSDAEFAAIYNQVRRRARGAARFAGPSSHRVNRHFRPPPPPPQAARFGRFSPFGAVTLQEFREALNQVLAARDEGSAGPPWFAEAMKAL